MSNLDDDVREALVGKGKEGIERFPAWISRSVYVTQCLCHAAFI
jgi:hypothetical protein